MKKFLKYVFATFTGTVLGIFVIILIIGGITFSMSGLLKEQTITISDNAILVISLQEKISEKTTHNPFDSFSPTEKSSTIGVFDICQSIQNAAKNDKIKGVVLLPNLITAQYSSVQEIHKALVDFKQSGKFIYSYADIYTQKGYLLASVADKIFMNPEGMFELKGITSNTIFIKDVLEKIGIEPVLFRAGKYKSAAENITRTNMSQEKSEQVFSFISDVWEHYQQSITTNRPALCNDFSTIVDSLLVWNAESAYTYGFIDSIAYYDSFLSHIRTELEIDETKKIPQISLQDYISYMQQQKVLEPKSEEKIALIIAEGSIDMGKGDDSSIGSSTYTRIIRNARQDTTIQAIVLRINSGGGSALASEIIWREVALAAQTKPVVVSMGDYAASGGYYIATHAHTIVAEPSTLTGSIGVFGMYVKTNTLMQKIGVHIDTVKTNTFSDFGSTTRDMHSREIAVITTSIDSIYSTFKQRVSEGRNLSLSTVEALAQGRIWSGTQALDLGLIDTLGGVFTAITIAAEKANILDDYSIQIFPKSKSYIEMLTESFMDSNNAFYTHIESIFGNDTRTIYSYLKYIPKKNGVYMQAPYTLTIE